MQRFQANSGDAADDDTSELNFLEFRAALKLLAGMLKIEWAPIEAASRFAEPLLKPRLFAKYAQGGALMPGSALSAQEDAVKKMYWPGFQVPCD